MTRNRWSTNYPARNSAGTPCRNGCGQRGALSLPLFPHEDVGPILRRIGQLCSHWICQNIIGFFAKAFFLAKTMFEEIALPFDLKSLGGPFFPFAYNCLNAFVSLRE